MSFHLMQAHRPWPKSAGLGFCWSLLSLVDWNSAEVNGAKCWSEWCQTCSLIKIFQCIGFVADVCLNLTKLCKQWIQFFCRPLLSYLKLKKIEVSYSFVPLTAIKMVKTVVQMQYCYVTNSGVLAWAEHITVLPCVIGFSHWSTTKNMHPCHWVNFPVIWTWLYIAEHNQG
jgi:hypothetical protein